MPQPRGQKIKRGQVTKMAALDRDGHPKPWAENLGVECGGMPSIPCSRNWGQGLLRYVK